MPSSNPRFPYRTPQESLLNRFKSDVVDQVKALIMDAMTQVTDEQDFSAISEPDFNFEAVQMPEDGDLTFEFNVEVRPEFDMPEWKGLDLEKVVHEYSDEEVDNRATELLQRYGDVEEVEGAIEAGDTVNVSIEFKDGDDVASTFSEQNIVRGNLSFADGSIEGFGDLVIGAAAGDSKTRQPNSVNHWTMKNSPEKNIPQPLPSTVSNVRLLRNSHPSFSKR